MSGTEARTTDDGTTGTTESRDDASSAAERLGGPREDEQSLDRASEGQADVGRRADTTADEGEQNPDLASEGQADVGRRADTTTDEDQQSSETTTEADVDRPADAAVGDGEQSPATTSEAETGADRRGDTSRSQRTTLIEPERAESYNSRWNQLKSEFVDDPRAAVRGANQLVGEVLDELEELFRSQRADLEHGLDSDQATTEDLRQALGRYRSFFDRLLSF
jgi:hypothetical protein